MLKNFFSKLFTGTVQESEEMRPKWFGIHEIPLEQMWIDDRYW